MPKKNERKAKMKSMRDRVKQHAKDSGKGSRLLNLPPNVEDWYPDEKGVFELDILPYVVSDPNHPDEVEAGELWYRRPYMIHFIERKPIVCPRSVNKPCPICEEVERLAKDYDADAELIRALKARKQCLFNYVDPSDKKQSIKVMDWSAFKFAQVLEKELDESDDMDICGFADLEGGHTIKFRVSEESYMGAKFLKTTRLDFRGPRQDYDEDILDKVVDLDTILRVKSYEDLAKLFLGEDTEKEEDEPKPKKKPKPGKKKPEPEPEEEDDDDEDDEVWDDDDEDDDEEEEPEPKKKPKPGKKKPEPEPEEEDDDDEDDWDDEDSEDDDDDEDDEDSEEDDDDDDEDDWDDDDEDDDDEDDIDPSSMNKEELIELLTKGELKGKSKKSTTALKRMALSELRKLVKGLL